MAQRKRPGAGPTVSVRESVIRALAKLSLILVLTVLGALFAGTGGVAVASTSGPDVAATSAAVSLSDANPLGLLVAGVILVAGLAVLTFGALKPSRPKRSTAFDVRRYDTRQFSAH